MGGGEDEELTECFELVGVVEVGILEVKHLIGEGYDTIEDDLNSICLILDVYVPTTALGDSGVGWPCNMLVAFVVAFVVALVVALVALVAFFVIAVFVAFASIRVVPLVVDAVLMFFIRSKMDLLGIRQSE